MNPMYLPYLFALKQHYSNILLSPSDVAVDVAIKNPQKGFKELKYPGIGIEYLTTVLNRNRIGAEKRVQKDTTAGTSTVRKALEPMDFMVYVHTFEQDSQATDALLMQKTLERTPYYFAVEIELSDGKYNCEIYREDFDNVIIEGMDREIHNVFTLHVWGWLDLDPIGTALKLVTAYPELRSVAGLDLSELPLPPV